MRRPADGVLRRGYTTGACAAAAAKAATLALLTGTAPEQAEILLPAGVVATFEITQGEAIGDGFRCTVIKDAGDDPDATHGAEIQATVRAAEGAEIAIMGGEGVGVVTRPGLELPVGSAAINPVPRRMIAEAVRSASADRPSCGFHVTISVPRGVEIAARTLNARLGILGGISILGTTGIVEPLSHAAYQTCIAQALDVARATGCSEVALTTGRRTELFAMRYLSLPEEAFVEMGDFVGFALEAARDRGFRAVTVGTMIGKMTKIAAGHRQTHADASPQSLHTLRDAAASAGAEPDLLSRLDAANTAREMSAHLLAAGAVGADAFQRLCAMAHDRCRQVLGAGVRVTVLLCGFESELWARAEDTNA